MRPSLQYQGVVPSDNRDVLPHMVIETPYENFRKILSAIVRYCIILKAIFSKKHWILNLSTAVLGLIFAKTTEKFQYGATPQGKKRS